ncbi:MAG TPA: pseudouridine synthase [Candidatus Tectomicrobia bacterium]|nr:pseudouridine synthase [Candidatus Tectomicrobia bacterium]
MLMRLQKVLAQAGIASRREAEQWLQAGRISVNGKVVTALGTQADPVVDRIAVDGKMIDRLQPKVYYLLNKPPGYASTCDDELGRPTVLDLLKPVKYRLFPVGRLDWNTEGLLLLTNDGELAQRLLHPRFHIRRTYLAKVEGIPTAETLRRLTHTGDPSAPRQRRPVVRLNKVGERHAWLEIRLWEGKNRQVRRMCEAVGHPVRRLRRVQFAGLDLMGLSAGQYRLLSPHEVLALKRLAGLERPLRHGD